MEEPPTISAGRLIASLKAWVPRALKTGVGEPEERGGVAITGVSIVDIARARDYRVQSTARRTTEDAEHLKEREAELLHSDAVHTARYVEALQRNEVDDAGEDNSDERDHAERRDRRRPARDAALAAAHRVDGAIARAAERAGVALVRRAAHLRVVVVPNAALIVEARVDLGVFIKSMRRDLRVVPRFGLPFEHAPRAAHSKRRWARAALRRTRGLRLIEGEVGIGRAHLGGGEGLARWWMQQASESEREKAGNVSSDTSEHGRAGGRGASVCMQNALHTAFGVHRRTACHCPRTACTA